MAKTPTVGFKKLSRWLVIALAVAVALVSYNVTIPAGRSSASNWKFVVSHPTILLHVIVATIILVMAVVMLVLAIRNHDQSRIVLSVIGLAFVLAAFASGEDYVMTLRKSSLDYMSIGWPGAIVTYGIGWYLGRRKGAPGTGRPGSKKLTTVSGRHIVTDRRGGRELPVLVCAEPGMPGTGQPAR